MHSIFILLELMFEVMPPNVVSSLVDFVDLSNAWQMDSAVYALEAITSDMIPVNLSWHLTAEDVLNPNATDDEIDDSEPDSNETEISREETKENVIQQLVEIGSKLTSQSNLPDFEPSRHTDLRFVSLYQVSFSMLSLNLCFHRGLSNPSGKS